MNQSAQAASETIRDQAISALEDLKARDIVALAVGDLTTVMDHMLIATGTSRRHVKALADNVQEVLREAGERPLGVEGDVTTGWILVDFGDVIVHVMSEEARAFYELEKLWTLPAES